MEKFIKQLVTEGGKILKKEFRTIGVAGKSKSDALDVVTHADLLAEKYIISAIKAKFPTHQIISEESGDNKVISDHTWVIDPLDGTLNFARGIATFVCQVAYIYKGKIEMSAVYDPMSDELYFAARGKGAYCNGKRIHCSASRDYSKSLLTFNGYYDPAALRLLNKISSASKNPHFRIRNTGTMGVAGVYTAAGKFDYFLSQSGMFWDYAPPYLILKEAGCVVKNFQGKDWQFSDKQFIAGNKNIVDSIIKILNKK